VATSISALLIWWIYDRNAAPGFRQNAALVLNSSLPDVSAKNLDGSDFKLSGISDRVVLVNFWASWCDPCVREFPSFVKTIDLFQDQITLIAVANDTEKQGIQNFIKAFDGHRTNIKFVWDPSGRTARRFGTNQYPETYIFDKHHVLAKKVIGMTDWGSGEMVKLLTDLTRANSP
jgi:thiol-disulfide isomerase/thioredoxin